MLEQCSQINPQSDAVYFQMAQILMGAGDIKNGKKYALKAFALNPHNFWYTMMLVGTYYSEHNLDSAIMYYEKSVTGFPDKEELALNLGNLYSENKNYDKALGVFEGLDKKYGINDKSTVSAVKVLVTEGKYNEAEVKLKALMEKFPGEIQYEGLMAEIYSNKGENEKAVETYKKLLEKDANNGETQLSLANFLFKNKSYDELSAVLDKIIINENIERDNKLAIFSELLQNEEYIKKKGNELQLTSMVMEALYKNDDMVLLLRPEIMYTRKMPEAAAQRLQEIIFERPDNYYAWEKLLFIYLELKDYKNLQEKAEMCSTKFNRSFTAKLLFATAATENKNFTVALEELRKAEILAGEDKEMMLQVLSLRSDIYYRMNDYSKAFSTFDEALKYNNNDLTVLNNYAYYLAEQNMRLKEAEEMAKKVVQTEKSNATFLDTYAWVLYKRGKNSEALKIMETIMDTSAVSDAEYYEHLGYMLKKKKDYSEAIKNWYQALKIDPTKTNLLKEIESCQKPR